MTASRSLSLFTLASLLGFLSFCGGTEETSGDTAPGAGGAAGQGAGGAGAQAGGSAQAGQSGGAQAGGSGGSAQAGGAQAGSGGSEQAGAGPGGSEQGGSAQAGSGGEGGSGAGGDAGGAGGSGGDTQQSGQGGVGGGAGDSGSGGAGAGGAGGAAGKGGGNTGGQSGGKANVIFVLADDFSWNLVSHMKNLQKMQEDGVTFANYFVTDSLCCPSRSSIFTGKMPHNTGVFANVGSDGGYDTFLAKKNDLATFAVALKAAGYKTGIGGKFMNGYQVKSSAKPKGWTDIFLASNGYPNFDYDLREDGDIILPKGPDLVHYGTADADYLTDVMLKLGTKFINGAKGDPFLLEIATFAPHAPFTAAPRHDKLFPNLKAPEPPNFNVKPTNPPPWLAAKPALTQDDLDQIDVVFRKRVRAVQAIDEMLGDLRATIAKDPKLANTYLIFSSDNGLHLGEHGLRAGKMTAYSTDIRVPLIVVGPGVPAGKTVNQVTQNIDLCPTFAELAQTDPPDTADGRSLVPLLHGEAVSDWRDAGLVEHHHADPDPGDPDTPDPTDPPDYSALRTKNRLFVRYTASGVNEFYDLDNDPYELKNIAGSLSDKERTHWIDWLKQARACKGAASCWAALHEPK